MKLWRWLHEQISDPVRWRRLNGYLVLFWIAMFPISIGFNLLSIVAYVSLLSLYANFAAHLGAWAASRAEVENSDN